MLKFYSFLLLFLSLNIFGQNNKEYLNLNQFLTADSDESNDISYLYLAPQFEENPDPAKAVVIEYYFGEFDEQAPDQSFQRLDLIKEIITDDQRIFENYPIEVLGINSENAQATPRFEKIIKHLKLQDVPTKFEKVPDSIYFNSEIYNDESKTTYFKKPQERVPSGFNPGRNFWTFIRFSASSGSTYAALVLSEGIAPGIAASVAIWPGLASGGITYFNGEFGNFLTNGSWSKWLLESDKKFAKILRQGLGLNPKTLSQHLIKTQKKYSNSKYFKDLQHTNPEDFSKIVQKDAQIAFARSENRMANITRKFGMLDEYVKWWATEVAFVTTSIKIPQAVAGISAASFLGSVGDVLTGASMGMLAQGPGDIAIQKRKYQKINELDEILKSNKIKISSEQDLKKLIKRGLVSADKSQHVQELLKQGYVEIHQYDELLDQVKKLKNPEITYVIGKDTHFALRKIENWARSRASLLSFFSVAGVGMEIAGIPLARPILIGVGMGGALYYSQVAGWLDPARIKKLFTQDIKQYFLKIRAGEIDFSLKGLLLRICSGKFKSKKVIH